MQTQPASETVNASHTAAPAGRSLNVEALIWVAVLCAAALWRLPQLGGLLPAPGEAVRAAASWEFAGGATPSGWSGDLTSALSALALRLSDGGLGWARFPSALMGVLSVAALALFRPYAGRAPALVAALLLAMSPLAVAAARTAGPDSAALLAGLLILWLALRLTERDGTAPLPYLGAAAGLALGTGAIAVVAALVAVAWVAVERAWLDRPDAGRRWRAVLADRARLRLTAFYATPGALLAVLRYGAGPDRLSFAALQDWSPVLAAEPLPWHAPLTLPLWYEPLALMLGLTAAGLLLHRARRLGPEALTPFERLLLVWLAAGLLGAAALHHRPGQLLIVLLPLTLLSAALIARALPALAALTWRDSGLVLLAVPLILGYVSLQLLSWEQQGSAPRDEVLAVILLCAVAVALGAFAATATRQAAAGLLTLAALVLLGWIAPHGASAVAYQPGDEPARGPHAFTERVALLQALQRAQAAGQPVAVELALARALAWELRGLGVTITPGMPPPGHTALTQTGTDQPPGSASLVAPLPVVRRWYPGGWDGIGIVRWLVHREAWGGAAPRMGEVVQTP